MMIFLFRRRLVCSYDNVTSIVNVDELGPVNKGCPYVPRRRKSDNRQQNGTYVDYFQE